MAWWDSVRGHDDTRNLEADAAAMGVTLPDELLRPEPQVVCIPPDAAPAVDLFFAIDTQWRSAPSGVWGLDYAVAMDLGREMIPGPVSAWLPDLKIIELQAVALMNEKRS